MPMLKSVIACVFCVRVNRRINLRVGDVYAFVVTEFDSSVFLVVVPRLTVAFVVLASFVQASTVVSSKVFNVLAFDVFV